MKKIRVTYTVVADIEPYGLDDDDAEFQRAVECVQEDIGRYAAVVAAEWVEQPAGEA
jgi:hypothetical protein